LHLIALPVCPGFAGQGVPQEHSLERSAVRVGSLGDGVHVALPVSGWRVPNSASESIQFLQLKHLSSKRLNSCQQNIRAKGERPKGGAR